VPLRQQIDCPQCGVPLVRKPGGRCPSCGADVARHVQDERAREDRIERVTAVIGTVLVLLLFAWTAPAGLLMGVLAYGGAGAAMFYVAKKTFR
jgi:uncharacterized paraquat-inducible protein A